MLFWERFGYIMGRLVTRLTRDADSVWLLELTGATDQELFRQITATGIPTILKILEQTEVRKLIIDLTTTQDFDSHGLQFLGQMRQQLAERNIPIILRNPSTPLRQILSLMQFDQVFEVEFDDNFLAGSESLPGES
jgi:anti-anti-sigma factor